MNTSSRFLFLIASALCLATCATGAYAQTGQYVYRPGLYVYEGAGCNALNGLIQFRAFIGRQEDGVVDFDDYTSTWANAVSELHWSLGCWKGQVKNIAMSIPMSVSSYSPTSGSTQFADIAAGKLDSTFTTMGANLVSAGFSGAVIRLGWEENGSWYPWFAGKNEAQWHAAFAHVYKVLKATPGSHFTILFNPSLGWLNSQQTADWPGGSTVDGIGWDSYANSWNSGGPNLEPGLWNGDLTGVWGINTVGAWPKGVPVSIPEFGVGSRNDGHGAPDGSTVNGGDDPYFMTTALQYFGARNAQFIGYWDYNAGDYNSKISDGSRPKEALAFLQYYGEPNQAAIFSINSTTFTTKVALPVSCSYCHAVAFQNGPAEWNVLVWAASASSGGQVSWGTASKATLYDPSQGRLPIQALSPNAPATLSLPPGKSLIVKVDR